MDATDEAAGREVRSHDDGGQKDAMPSAAARNAMLLLAAVVFIGWLMMWAVWPTRTNSLTWSPKLTVRRRMFELFYYTHHLYIVLLVLYVLHVGATFFCYILPGRCLPLHGRPLPPVPAVKNPRPSRLCPPPAVRSPRAQLLQKPLFDVQAYEQDLHQCPMRLAAPMAPVHGDLE